ncbi:MAG: C39 family peptidase [Synergistaceae bacterium]|nr:C39 family peptidase [Synergistaceae bacterium]
MKKLLILIVLSCLCASFAAAEPVKVIPYPAGTDTKTEGASSAPQNINHKYSIYFDTMTDYFELQPNERRIILPHFPTYQQTKENTCGPAAALTVLYYYGNTDYTEASLAVEMKTQPYPIGANPKDMLAFFERLGWHTDSSLTHKKFEDYDSFKNFIIANLKRNIPIMVENIEWGGHWRVIIGYDDLGTASTLDDVLIMADPYDTCDHKQDGYAVNNGEKFYSMWFDHSMLPKDQAEQPFIIASPVN